MDIWAVFGGKVSKKGGHMEKNAIGYNDLCEAVGKATLNLVSYKQEVTKEYIISMLESFAQIECDEKRRATYIMAAEAMKE